MFDWLNGTPATPATYATTGYGAPMATQPGPVMGMPAIASDFGSYLAPSTMGDANWSNGYQGGSPQLSAGTSGSNGFMGWFDKNGQGLGSFMSGLGSLGQAWMGYQQAQAAQDALKFQKQAFQANLRNSTQSYNNSLEDRIRGRTSDYAGKEADVQSYLSKHQLHI